MTFIPFTREFVRTTAPKITISNFGRISINNSASDLMAKSRDVFAILLWEAATNRVGIQPVKKEDKTTYHLKAYGPKGTSGTGFSAVTFLNFINYDWSVTRSFSVEWNASDNMLVFTIPQEHLGGHKGGLQPSRRKAHMKKEE
jgi:hypothetical protein